MKENVLESDFEPLCPLSGPDLTYGAFPLHGTVRFGTARYGSVRVGCISTAV